MVEAFVRGIFAGAPDRLEARKLAAHAIGSAWNAERKAVASCTGGEVAIAAYEEALASVGDMAGLGKDVHIRDAKNWLRQQGHLGGAIAIKLGAASSKRISAAHPVATLKRDLRKLKEHVIDVEDKPVETLAKAVIEVQLDSVAECGRDVSTESGGECHGTEDAETLSAVDSCTHVVARSPQPPPPPPPLPPPRSPIDEKLLRQQISQEDVKARRARGRLQDDVLQKARKLLNG